MALFDDIKTVLRVTTDAMDAEVEMLIDAALYDMERTGVNPELLALNIEQDLDNRFVKSAVAAFCKAGFGYDNPEAARFDEAYRRFVCDLLNSSENIAAIANEPEEEPNLGFGLGIGGGA